MIRKRPPLGVVVAHALLLVSLLTPQSLMGQESTAPNPEAPNPEPIKVIVWGDGRWNYVEMIQEKYGSIIYQKPGGIPVAAKVDALDEKTTLRLNKAFETFSDACAGKSVDLADLFELTGRTKKLFFSIAGRHSNTCLQHLSQDYQQSLIVDEQLPTKRRISDVAGAITVKKDEDGNVLIDDIPPATPTPVGWDDSESPNHGNREVIPTYIKGVSVSPEGPLGIRVFVTLGDDELNAIAVGGELKIFIQRKGYYRNSGESYYSTLLTKSWFVDEKDFKSSYGDPRFDSGRISYKEISDEGKWAVHDKVGRVFVSFKPWVGEKIVGFDDFVF